MKQVPVILPLFGYEALALSIQQAMGYELGEIIVHEFPDEEILVTIQTPFQDREVIFIGSLDRPNPKIATLLFAAQTAKTLGAKSVGWIAPYLPYMRQDKVFHPGEGITSQYFARLISAHMDWMITVDPHLHRWHALSELYTIPSTALEATPCLAQWIGAHCKDPLLIGPDSESTQWVSALATQIHAPFVILEKERHGDDRVTLSTPHVDAYRDKTPVLVDDIISSAATMIATVEHLTSLHMKAPLCIGVHGIFAGGAYEALVASGVDTIATCNTVLHGSNAIDISPVIIEALQTMLNT